MACKVIILNHLRVSHHFIWQQRRQIFRESIIATAEVAPFLTLVLKAINIDCHGRSGKPQDGTKRGVGAVANEGGIVTAADRVNGGKKSVNDCIEILVPDCWQDFQPDAVIFQLSR